MSDWRLARALEGLRNQVNERWPNRRKDSDGSIGDVLHASRSSDHNPWVREGAMGIVTAIDITHDPRSGCDSYALAEVLRAAKDPRVKYLISNRKICSSEVEAWKWRPYSGINPHDHHLHISVKADKGHYDSDAPWVLDAIPMPAPTFIASTPPPTLRWRDKGEAVRELQSQLVAKGIPLKLDGDYGPVTLSAVKRFQIASGLVADGIVGPQTWAALKH